MEDRDRIKAWNDLWFAFSEMFKCSSRFVASICLGICINRVEKRMKPILWELTRETLLNPRRLYLRWNIHARVMKSLRMRGRRNIPICCSNNKSRQIALQTCVSRITLTIESIAIFQSIKPKFLPFHEWSKPCNRARTNKQMETNRWNRKLVESSPVRKWNLISVEHALREKF